MLDAPLIFQNLSLHKLHGNLPVEERAGHMRDFAAASSGVLLTTDVAARGLDVPQVRTLNHTLLSGFSSMTYSAERRNP